MMPRPLTPPIESFMQKALPEPNSGCWLWDGALFWDGYGQFNYFADGKWNKDRAHRVSYRLFRGEPGDLHVLHKCDVPSCVNPDHLFLGDQDSNMADMTMKGRRAQGGRVASKGGAHPLAVATEENVREIRSSPERTYLLARRLNLSWSTVNAIRKRITWRHI